MRPISFCLIVLALLTAPSWRTPLADDSKFHPTQTEAEKALDRILGLAVKDANLLYFALGRPWYDPAKDIGYARLFSKALLNAWRKREAVLARENCGERYREEDGCGLDYNPIVCGQDWPDSFLFRTIKSGNANATIIAVGEGEKVVVRNLRSYRLVKRNGGWKLDGVDCGEEHNSFNMPSIP